MNHQNDADTAAGIADRRKRKKSEIGERDTKFTFGRAWTHDGIEYKEGDIATLTKVEVADLKNQKADKPAPDEAKAKKATSSAPPLDTSSMTDVAKTN